MTGDNRLSDLAGRVADLHREIEGHQPDAARKALDAGEALCGTKDLAGHGNWSEWLAGTGIGERSAQRYMRMHRYALNSDTVSDLGGIGATLEWLKAAADLSG